MGDQFAMLEAVVALALLVQHVEWELVEGQDISMTTGATIHTKNVRNSIHVVLNVFDKWKIRN